MDEDVLAAIVADDEAEALRRIEEFDDAFALANDLGRHATAAERAADTATAARAAEATASASAEAVSATTTEAVSATAEAIAASAVGRLVSAAVAAGKIVFAEPVALISAAPAT